MANQAPFWAAQKTRAFSKFSLFVVSKVEVPRSFLLLLSIFCEIVSNECVAQRRVVYFYRFLERGAVFVYYR